ncbi:PAAR domain-containing protein, partial [Photorhabdus sp. RM125S]
MPVAAKGDLVSCPKCKGVFPIVEGSDDLKHQGKPIALEGMHTACGAKLIASQKDLLA